MRPVLALIASLVTGVISHPAVAQQLKPLLETDIMPGCGCRFVVEGQKMPTLHWSWVGAKQAAVREGGKVFWLDLQNEKYIPEKRQPPKYGDRMVLFLADMNWRVQVVATVEQSCAPKVKSCSGALYKAKLIVQNGAGKREELPATGHCGC